MVTSKKNRHPLQCLYFLLLPLTTLTHAFQPDYHPFWLPNKETLLPPHEQHGSYFHQDALPEPVSYDLASASNFIPRLHIPGKPEWQQLNDNTWKAFFSNLRPNSTHQEMAAFVSPRVSSQFSQNEFFWDQAFISLGYGLYGHKAFNTLGGLDCFYNQQHPDGYIPREIKPDGHDSRFFEGQSFYLYVSAPPVRNSEGEEVYDLDLKKDDELFQGEPDKWIQYQTFRKPLHQQRDAIIRMYGSENNSNPPLAAHAEWRHYLLSRNLQRLIQAYPALEAHTRWLENKRQLQNGSLSGLFWQRPMGSGMDNLPGTVNNSTEDLWSQYLKLNIVNLTDENFFKETQEHKLFASFDMSAQMKLHYDAMVAISRILGKEADADTYRQKSAQLKEKINQCFWDEKAGFYFDVHIECQLKSSQYTLSAYWALYAEVASTKQAERMLRYLRDENYFATPMPFSALAKTDRDFYEHGNYWQGGVWPPLVYITIKGLMNYVDELPEAWDIAIEASTDYLDLLTKNMFQPALVRCHETSSECSAGEDQIPQWQRIYEYNSPSDGGPGQRKDVDVKSPERYAKANYVGWGGLGPVGLMQEVALGIEVHETEIIWHHHLEEYAIENLSIGNGSIDLRVDSSGNVFVENARSLPSSLTQVRVISKDLDSPEFIIPITVTD